MDDFETVKEIGEHGAALVKNVERAGADIGDAAKEAAAIYERLERLEKFAVAVEGLWPTLFGEALKLL